METSSQTYTPLVLIVEDDRDVRTIYSSLLIRNGYRTLIAANGDDALTIAKAHSPNLALVDIMLPGISGREVAAWLREYCPGTKIIFVTALDSIEVAVEEMHRGAFYYLTKPVRFQELLETVERAWTACRAGVQVRRGDLVIDLREGWATLENDPLPLTALESKLLVSLAQRQGCETSYNELWQEVWGYDGSPDRRVIHKALSRLREKIGEDRLISIRGRGYLLQ